MPIKKNKKEIFNSNGGPIRVIVEYQFPHSAHKQRYSCDVETKKLKGTFVILAHPKPKSILIKGFPKAKQQKYREAVRYKSPKSLSALLKIWFYLFLLILPHKLSKFALIVSFPFQPSNPCRSTHRLFTHKWSLKTKGQKRSSEKKNIYI